MKILIVDDGDAKIEKLKEHLSNCAGIQPETILFAQSAFEARNILREHNVDLLVLDIVLPRRTGEEPSAATAVELLSDISLDEQYRRPRFIVGLTAHEEVQRIIEPEFQSRLWTIIYFDLTSDEWLHRLSNIVYYLKPGEHPQTFIHKVDLCVITALQDPEMIAVHKLPWNWMPDRPIDDSTFVRDGCFESGGSRFTVVSAVAPRMGMVATSLLAANLINRLHPRYIVLVGICAGIEGKVNIGDVILANPGWDYQSGKRFIKDEQPGFAISPHQLDLPESIVSRAHLLCRDTSFWRQVQDNWPIRSEKVLKMLVGPVASGSAVIADSEVIEEVKLQKRDLLGVEMEIYGLYAAVAMSSRPKPTALSFKAVCDFADPRKNDNHQSYAAYTAACALKEFFERHMHDIAPLAGS